MNLKDSYDFENLINETERIVIEQMELQLQEDNAVGICKCQDCILDMTAFALNSVKPHYRVNLIGTLYRSTLDEGDYYEEVSSAVASAIKKISENPSHD